jgi:hypothetical protein
MDPAGLVATARSLIDSSDRQLGSTRLLAGALLLRQALEDSLDHYWSRTVPGMEKVSGRVQLVSLPFYLEPARLASDVTYAWYRLSASCHHDAYELPPAPEELVGLADIVDRLLSASDL